MYELTNRVHPGGGDTFTKLCAGNGRTKGTPLKTVNWAGIGGFHPYVRDIECWLVTQCAAVLNSNCIRLTSRRAGKLGTDTKKGEDLASNVKYLVGWLVGWLVDLLL